MSPYGGCLQQKRLWRSWPSPRPSPKGRGDRDATLSKGRRDRYATLSQRERGPRCDPLPKGEGTERAGIPDAGTDLAQRNTRLRGHPDGGVALRAWSLAGQSFTRDELYDLTARCNFSEIVHRADGFPPLYALTLHGWLGVFGVDIAARWLLVLVGLGSIASSWRLARRVGGMATGLWAAAILAAAPIHVYFSQETRAYGLYFFWAAATLWAFFRAGRATAAAIGRCSPPPASVGSTRTTTLPSWSGCSPSCCWHRRGGKAESGRWKAGGECPAFSVQLSAVPAFAAVTLGSLPLLDLLGPDLRLQAGYPGQTGFGVAQWGYTYFSFLSGFTLGPSMRDLHALWPATPPGNRSPGWPCLDWLPFRWHIGGSCDYAKTANSREKGDRHHLPERPGGCCAEMVPVPFLPESRKVT